MKNLGLLFGGLSFFSYLRGHEYSGPVKDICAVTAGEGFGQNDHITGTAADTNSTGAARVDLNDQGVSEKSSIWFTFTGTGIDIYCTTDSASGYVTAGIFKQENGEWTLLSEKTQTIRNYSAETHYNVPTVSFLNVGEYGTYKVKLNVLKDSQYKLDGVRVYGAMANQETVYTKNNVDDHANAAFESLRTLLLNDAADRMIDGRISGAKCCRGEAKLNRIIHCAV